MTFSMGWLWDFLGVVVNLAGKIWTFLTTEIDFGAFQISVWSVLLGVGLVVYLIFVIVRG